MLFCESIFQCTMCSILPTNSFTSIPLPVSYSLYNNRCHPITPLCETYNHLGLLSAYKFCLHNQGLRVKYHTNAPARHRTRVCSRQVEESECRDIPAKTSEGVQSVQLEELVGKDSLINSSARDFLVVTFYKFVRIEDPEGEVAKHRSFLQGRDIHGRIYMSQQGINAQYSGPSLDALSYANWVKEDARFEDIVVQISPSSGHAFPRLKLRHKFSLLQVEGGVSHLPLLDPSMRAMPLSSSEWKRRLNATNSSEIEFDRITNTEITSKDQGRNVLLLDVRNGYEWDIGHFQGAKRPNVDCFRNTSFGISDSERNISDPLAGVDKASTDIMMYCTGGIRCDVYSVILRQKGFQNLYTLKGGITQYLKEEGHFKWIGNLFVFDSRLSVSPNVFKPINATKKQRRVLSHGEIQGDQDYLAFCNSTFGRCHLCGSLLSEMRHRNCANLDCNRLILSCQECVQEYKGCCSTICKSAPRLRPILYDAQPYERWHKYRDSICSTQNVRKNNP